MKYLSAKIYKDVSVAWQRVARGLDRPNAYMIDTSVLRKNIVGFKNSVTTETEN